MTSVKKEVFEYKSLTQETTLEFGRKIGKLLIPGDVVGLIGELGAGKTWFAKGLAFGLDVPKYEYVNSPAYDIIHEYMGRCVVYHFDFYRLDDIGEDEYFWLEEYIGSDGVCIAEWADKFLHELTDSFLRIEIFWDLKSDIRTFRIVGEGPRYGNLTAAIREEEA